MSSLFLDLFPGLPVSLPVPLVSTDSTNKETCNLLDGLLIRRWIFLAVWPLVKGRRSLLAFATFAFPLRFRIRSSRGLGRLGRSQHRAKDSAHSHNRVQALSLTLSETLGSFEICIQIKIFGRADCPQPQLNSAEQGKMNCTRTSIAPSHRICTRILEFCSFIDADHRVSWYLKKNSDSISSS